MNRSVIRLIVEMAAVNVAQARTIQATVQETNTDETKKPRRSI